MCASMVSCKRRLDLLENPPQGVTVVLRSSFLQPVGLWVVFFPKDIKSSLNLKGYECLLFVKGVVFFLLIFL